MKLQKFLIAFIVKVFANAAELAEWNDWKDWQIVPKNDLDLTDVELSLKRTSATEIRAAAQVVNNLRFDLTLSPDDETCVESVSPILSTLMYGPPDQMAQEDTFLAFIPTIITIQTKMAGDEEILSLSSSTTTLEFTEVQSPRFLAVSITE